MKKIQAECRSVGYLVRSDRRQLTVVQSLDGVRGENGVEGGISIPRCCVRKIRKVELKEE